MLHPLLFWAALPLRNATQRLRATWLLPIAYCYKPDAELMVFSGEPILLC
jgi:hypothetical protein